MRPAAALAAILLLAACAGDGERKASEGQAVVFSFFEDTPGMRLACPGVWAADRTGRITGVAGPAAFYPRFSADGRLLALGTFSEGEDVDLPLVDVHVLDVATGKVRGVVENVWPDVRWSPVGPQFLALALEGRAGRLLVVHADGAIRTVANSVALEAEWAPDGKRIAYNDDDGLWIVSSDGSERRRVARAGGGLSWAPDGRRLAFLSPQPPSVVDHDLTIIAPDGSGERRLMTLRVERRFVAWTRDGGILVLAAPPTAEVVRARELGVGDLYRVDVASGRRRLVASRILPIELHGDRLLFTRAHSVDGEWVFTVRIAPAGSRPERVLAAIDEQDVNGGSLPSWQPRAAGLVAATGELAPSARKGCADAIAALRDRIRNG